MNILQRTNVGQGQADSSGLSSRTRAWRWPISLNFRVGSVDEIDRDQLAFQWKLFIF